MYTKDIEIFTNRSGLTPAVKCEIRDVSFEKVKEGVAKVKITSEDKEKNLFLRLDNVSMG